MIFGLNEFKILRDFIYKKTGIYIGNEKVYFLKKRVMDRLKELNIDNINNYIHYLKYVDRRGKELQELINSITINETYFFREFSQLQAFGEVCLYEVIENKGSQDIKILSAGCSSGEEPYTLSIIMQELLDPPYTYKIYGVDIDENILKKARAGIYNEYSIKHVPQPYLEKYFIITEDGKYKIKNNVKKYVEFFKANLSDSNSLLKLGKGFDFIFCRNVLIYFSEESRREVIETFYSMLNSGGYIFLGHSESMSRISNAFKLKRAGDMIVYQKP
ncbi:protein-glutamate O-methyltransferase CheR [Marinitoga sp. 1138]|uniref:CheR family methyltransferase n=1 Tax=Marinitoga sp. 1138 TaxID=1643334 RepID=UPI0015863C10|nr:protein-glutamate O-methyltransferase CheR [Marinitoga sp. 1138]NUU96903.1 chemotaxis protein [Marinitoga sp. 1138]